MKRSYTPEHQRRIDESVAFLESLDNPNPDPRYGLPPQTNYPIGSTHSIGGIRELEMTSQVLEMINL